MGRVIGITGGIASGKSSVSTYIRELGFAVVDADVAAREVVEPGEEAYHDIVKAFGEDILLPDGGIDRAKLGTLIFHDEDKRLRLNNIVHPAVRKRMKEQTEKAFQDGAETVFMDIPLLFESKLTYMVEKSLLIYVDEEVQLQRLMKRNDLSESEALARIHSQMPLVEKKALADAVVDNNGELEETKQQVLAILKQWDIR
ncbi:dephospho-CoA kinase [Peribacillus asahii]|uniref:dephospho-CoA kinase n=1 Tax=Peribacillus asahii TaxID=228899 RepID=UPI0020795305|nr:dephospho-CoA kinase [Peribacillus asahii]USK69463.1 dephospho-CoA kinase [Peribacillus asahii]